MKYLTNSGLSYFLNKIKAYIASQLNSKASVIHTHTKSDIIDFPNGYVVDSTLDGTSSNAIANSAVVDALDGKSNTGHTHTKSQISDFPTLATVATSGSYNDLSNKPTTMTPKSHTHGNITNAGVIGSTANKPLITSTNGVITTGSFGTTANTFCEGNDSRLSDARTPTSHTHTKSEITDFPTLATVATSGSYNDLSNKPTIPTVNNATLKIQKNGTDIKTFTANASSNVTCNITVPTKTSDLTNDSGFLTSHQSLSNYSTLANTVKSLSISGKTITVTPGSGDAYTLTTQDTAYTHPTSSGNKHIPSGGSSGQFLGWDSDGTAKWVNNPNSDTKNTAGSTDTSSKIFLIGATSQAANSQTYSHDTAYVGTDGCLYSGGTKVLTSHQSLSNYSTLANTIKSLSISGRTITYTKGDDTTGTLTTQDNNTWTAMVGATSSSNGSVGYVNAVPPKDGYNTKYLRADGTWQVPPDHTYNVYNKTLTIQKNGTNVATFTSNSNTDVTANISVPTKTSQLTNDSGFLTSHQSLSNYSTLANTIKSLSISGKTITYTKGNGTTGTLTTQDTNTTYSNFVKSGSGAKAGLVPAPSTTAGTTKYLREDGTWQVPPDHTYTVNNATLTIQKNGSNVATFTANASSNATANITVPTKVSQLTNDSGFLTSHQSLSGYVPRSGGAVMTGNTLSRAINNDELRLDGGTGWGQGASVVLSGKDKGNYTGYIRLVPQNGSVGHTMMLIPDGGWVWDGTACQITSDQRLKQQISNIDDKLLDAWEDVLPCQFKYNEAVEQKGDNARLHTGYAVQQIDEACQKHDVDISAYGLYCHEEYPERTEEVEVEQEDGTIKKETRVIEEASEHYSLRYTETLVVECAYLRRENSRLKENLASIEERLKKLENQEK